MAFGLLSVVSGMALILWPLEMASLYGLPHRIARLLGIRDVVIGAGLLPHLQIRGFMWARSASETFDTVLIGIAAYSSGHYWGGAWRGAVALLAAALALELALDSGAAGSKYASPIKGWFR